MSIIEFIMRSFTSSSQQITVFNQNRAEMLKILHEDLHEILYES